MPFYAVANGRVPGIYDSWQTCSNQVHKFKSARYKKFTTREEAERFIIDNRPASKPDHKSISRSITTRNLSASLFASSPSPSLKSATSLESVIFDRITPKAKQNCRALSTNVLSEETIVLSDDEQPNSPAVGLGPSRQSETDLSVILLDDEDGLLPEPSAKPAPAHETKSHNGKQKESNGSIKRPSQRKANTRSSTKKTKQNNSAPISGDLSGSPNNQRSSSVTSTAAAVTKPAVQPPPKQSRPQPIKLNLKTKLNDENQSRNETNKAPQNKGHVVVYTDGACSNNGHANAKAGIGVWWGDNDPRNVSEPLAGRATNNRAEIWAAVKAINKAAEEGYDSITVCSDRWVLSVRSMRTNHKSLTGSRSLLLQRLSH